MVRYEAKTGGWIVYDFNRCKLCGQTVAAAKYKLKGMTLYACENCDFHFIDALDEIAATDSEHPQLTAAAIKFIDSKLPQNTAQLKTNLQFVKTHATLDGAHCLDIGSGAGVFPSLLQHEAAEVLGIEPQQVFREYAAQKFQLTLRRELVDTPYWQDNYLEHFDLMTVWDTLEHVNFPVETITAAASLLKPGGQLFLDTPSRDSFFYRASEWSYNLSNGTKPLLLKTLYSPKPYRHKQIFTSKQLWALLENAGFSSIERSKQHRSNNKLVVVAKKATN
jgi:2-polyprenyl-6-hydroxyphenyl methylase/3-demethylubiquinone-9 3-methyltransferase